MRLVLMHHLGQSSLDLIKFAITATLINYLCDHHNKATAMATSALAETDILMMQTQSHAASIHKLLYSNQTSSIRHTVLKVGCGGCGGYGGLADIGVLWMRGTCRCGGLVDMVVQWTCGRVELVDHECDQGPGDGKEGWGLCCSHIGSKNTSFF